MEQLCDIGAVGKKFHSLDSSVHTFSLIHGLKKRKKKDSKLQNSLSHNTPPCTATELWLSCGN